LLHSFAIFVHTQQGVSVCGGRGLLGWGRGYLQLLLMAYHVA